MASNGVRVAVEGCGHGTLNSIYASVEQSCKIQGWDGVDLLIIGGDFQAVRNSYDLNCMSVPVKYREIGDFHEYYSGKRAAPYLTVFIGGNHEASNHLWELYYGGWVAPNIYYMGAANVLRFGPLRIAGLSGIWKGYSYRKPHYERIPYSQDDVKSAYHVREWDVRKLLQIRSQVDVGLSHDWPRGVENHGNMRALFRKKPDFERDSREGQLGSLAARKMMDRLRPPYWFSAHLHVKFAASIPHDTNDSRNPAENIAVGPPAAPQSSGPIKNEEEIDLDMEDDAGQEAQDKPAHENTGKSGSGATEDETSRLTAQVASGSKNNDEIDLDMDDVLPGNGGEAAGESTIPQDIRSQLPASFAKPTAAKESEQLPTPDISNSTTKFLSLDKCLPNRHFLQLVELPPLTDSTFERPLRLEYDCEWLAITRVFAQELPNGDPASNVPADKGEAYYRPLIEREEAWVEENLIRTGKMMVPEDFTMTAPAYEPSLGLNPKGQNLIYNNPHTQKFCDLLQISNPFRPTAEESQQWAGETKVIPPDEPSRAPGRGGRGGRGGGGWRGGQGRGRGGGRGGRGGRGGGRSRGGYPY